MAPAPEDRALLDALARTRAAAFARLDAGDRDARAAMLDCIDALDAFGPGAMDLGRALIALDRGDPPRAHAALGAAAGAAPAGSALERLVTATRARLAVDENQPALAGPLLDALPADDPDVRVMRARLAFHQGDREGATAALEAVLAEHPDHAEALLGAGIVALTGGQLRPALARLRDATRAMPFDPRPWRALVRAALLTGAVEPALQWTRRVLGNPLRASPACLVDLAELCICGGHPDEAAALLEGAARAGRVGPQEAIALGRLWAKLGPSGVPALQTLAAALPGSPAAAVLDALQGDARGRPDASAWRRAWDAAPDHWLAAARYGLAALTAGDRDAAVAASTRIAAVRRPEARLLRALLAPDDAESQRTLAWAAGHPGLLPSVRAAAARATGSASGA